MNGWNYQRVDFDHNDGHHWHESWMHLADGAMIVRSNHTNGLWIARNASGVTMGEHRCVTLAMSAAMSQDILDDHTGLCA